MPGCAASLAELIDGRMYATRNITKGSYVEVSRLLLLPANKVRDIRPLEQFVWHSRLELSNRHCQFLPSDPYTCYEEAEDEEAAAHVRVKHHYVVLPMLTGSLYQPPRPRPTSHHNPPNASSSNIEEKEEGAPSLEYFWWHVKSGNEFGRVEGLPEDLGEKYFPDWRKEECPDLLFVAFLAARDITEGE